MMTFRAQGKRCNDRCLCAFVFHLLRVPHHHMRNMLGSWEEISCAKIVVGNYAFHTSISTLCFVLDENTKTSSGRFPLVHRSVYRISWFFRLILGCFRSKTLPFAGVLPAGGGGRRGAVAAIPLPCHDSKR